MTDTSRNQNVFASKVRTLTTDEMKHVGGGEYSQNEISDTAPKPSAIKIDSAGYFR